jgi:AcrR family transcriptional regulator
MLAARGALKTRKAPIISERKRPGQARSKKLVEDILEGAIRVLGRDGARRFTTARVAAAAGVSVGSLYQYFPNKESILFRLQTDEWRRTGDLLEGILADARLPPLDRLRSAVHAFFMSECEEAELRVALGDASPAYRDSPQTAEHRQSGMRLGLAFMKEIAPEASSRERRLAADVVMTTLSSVGKAVSERGQSRSEVSALAAAVSDMLCGYLRGLQVR